MNVGKLIMYSVGEKVSLTKLKKDLGNDYNEAIELGYFLECQEGSNEEPEYVFTNKGKDFAWKKR